MRILADVMNDEHFAPISCSTDCQQTFGCEETQFERIKVLSGENVGNRVSSIVKLTVQYILIKLIFTKYPEYLWG